MSACQNIKDHRMQWNLTLTRTLNVDTLNPNTLLQPYFVEEAPFRNLLKLNNAHELNLVTRLTVDLIKLCIHLKNEHMNYLKIPVKYLKWGVRPRPCKLWLRATESKQKHVQCGRKDKGRPWKKGSRVLDSLHPSTLQKITKKTLEFRLGCHP